MNNEQMKQALSIMKAGKEKGMSHLSISGGAFSGYEEILETGESFVNFSICDYHKLSVDQRLRKAAAGAVMENGVYTAVSRTYMKLDIYRRAENVMADLFGKPVIITPRTTLGHIAAIPVLVDKNDAVILDHQVHTSVRLACDMLKGYGVHIEIVRHNRMDKLETRIQELSSKYERIWYMADGIYSMFGDVLPAAELEKLMNRYPQFRLYVDDAHGMGWCGQNGKGWTLSKMKYHKQMFLSTSLGKGFGAGGGLLVCPDEETREKILFTGSTLIFTSPPEPSVLGAIIESAGIHQSKEISLLQNTLREQMQLFYDEAEKLELPVIDKTLTPIAFIAAGIPDMVIDVCRGMLSRGYHITPGVFPATPYHQGGVRVVLSLYQTKSQIREMLKVLKEEYDLMLKKYQTSVEAICSKYKK
ncbi:MAG: aminotransferase class I/II-fold pyridoxal phosphate-dependent enzyme [Bacteroidota bacterium]